MRSDRERLLDILNASAVIEQYLPKDRAVFDGDAPLQSHIYRHLWIVGEAVWRLSKPLRDAHPKVALGMKQVMVQDYYNIDWAIVFATATNNIPTLKSEVEQMLAGMP